MEWRRTIQDVEHYTVIDCDTRTRTLPGGKTETYRECEPESRTRVVGEWVTTGIYPAEPAWEVNYRVRYSERRTENYWVVFSDDGTLYNYRTSSLADYERFKPREKHRVTLNIFGMAIKAE